VSDSSTDSVSNTVMVEDQIQSTVSDTGTTQQSYLQLRKNTVTLQHEDSGTTIQRLQMGDNSTTLSSDDGTDTSYVTLFPTSAEIGVTNKVALSLDSTDATFSDFRTTTKGIEYGADYSSGYTSLSLITKGDLDAATSGTTSGLWSGSTGLYSLVPNNQSNTAAGDYSLAGGGASTASGTSAFAWGQMAFATGDGSFAFGASPSASGVGSVCFGPNVVTGSNSFSIGGNNNVSGQNSAAFGGQTVASGNQSLDDEPATND
jgi:hypothetical protein